jgi:hypothetical protein
MRRALDDIEEGATGEKRKQQNRRNRRPRDGYRSEA